MTTITIERAFLIKVLDQLDIAQSLLERSQHHAKIAAMYKELRAALSAPATAPEQPSWHDAPTVPGLWVSDFSWMAQKLDRETVEFYAKSRSIPSRRWYGPIPEDKP